MFGAMTVLGPAQARRYAWRMQGGVFAGVVVKLGLRWEGADQRMVAAGAVPVVEEARHHKNNFAHSPIYPSDIVPYRPYADLIVDATAHPQGGATTAMPRIVLERAGRKVIDKRLLVQAESAWPSVAEVAGAPAGVRASREKDIGGATADGAAPADAASPFAISAPGPARAIEAPLPGAPWETDAAARPVVRPQPGDTTAEPVSQPDAFEATPSSEAASTVGVHTEEPATKRPEDPFSTEDAAETTDAASERGVWDQEAAAQRQAREEEARAESMRREVAAREADERARFEAEEAERRRQSKRQARLEAEREP